MAQQEDEGYKDRVLNTLKYQYDTHCAKNKKPSFIHLNKIEQVKKAEQDAYDKLKSENVVKFLTEGENEEECKDPAENEVIHKKMQFDAKGNWTAIPAKKKRGLTIQEKIDAIRSRTDIFNVIHIKKPSKIEIDNMKPPDMRKIINNTVVKKLEK
jgi:hypothetical protein